MNKSGIEWCDHTFNPITGCRHGCEYCYAQKMSVRFSGDIKRNKAAVNDYQIEEAKDGSGNLYVLNQPMMSETGNPLVYPFGFAPTLHRYRFDILQKLKMGNNIFVGAMADLFGEWVPDKWIQEVIRNCEAYPQHNFLFLTKNPVRYLNNVPSGLDNMWYGTTITRESEMSRFNSLPAGCRTFVSMEPILEDLRPEKHDILFRQVDWIILGAETGNRKMKVTPEKAWIHQIVSMADKAGIPVFMKESLVNIVGEKNMRRQFPERLRKKSISPKMENKLFSTCCVCKTYMQKSKMLALCVRSQRGEQPKQYAFMCQDCFRKQCREYGIELPNLAAFKEE